MEDNNIKLFVNGDVKHPQRNFGDAGIDFFVPNKTGKFIADLKEKNTEQVMLTEEGILLQPGYDVLIPTYVHSRFSSEWCLRASNKSGIATKQKLRIGAEIIDSSYEGMIHIHLFNDGLKPTTIKYGQKIVQFVPIKVNDNDIEIVTANDTTLNLFYKDHNSERGDGGFGHTGI